MAASDEQGLDEQGLDDQKVRRQLSELPSLNEGQRAGFLIELGWSRTGRSTPGIRPFLSDPAPLVRIAAAQALWQTQRDTADLEELVTVLIDGLCQTHQPGPDEPGLDEDLSLMAGTALVQMEDAAIGPLIRQFRDRGGRDALIVRVLGEIGDVEVETPSAVRSFLVEASRSEVDLVATEAKEALDALQSTHPPSQGDAT